MSTPLNLPVPTAVRHALDRLAAAQHLSEVEAEAAFGELMTGTVPPAAIRDLLLGLREQGESAAELGGAVRALRAAMRTVHHADPDTLVDTCGTGGGTTTTINVSTAAAFVAAGAGIPVAKHGNRSHTSRSGSADVLEAMGIPVDSEPTAAARILAQNGLVFLFAPIYHPAMRHVAPVRRELGVPTLMNLVGPLANPAGVRRQVVGISDPSRGPMVADALRSLGTLHALVVYGEVGIDEISPVGATQVWEVAEGSVREWRLDPADFGAGAADLSGLEGGTPEENARRIVALFAAPASAPAALRSAVVLNAAAAVMVSGRVRSFGEAQQVATASLERGEALAQLERLRVAVRLSISE